MADKNTFEILNAINVSEHLERKPAGRRKNAETGQWEDYSLSYLSWPWSWAEVKKRYPNASYRVVKDEHSIPYVYDPKTGYMVYTEVTIEGVTHDMWLPVMDGANNAMKAEPYSFETSTGRTVNVAAATMFDVNKTIMRCLVKNLAMFGLGLYIYAGEDLPEGEREPVVNKSGKATKKATKEASKEPPKEEPKLISMAKVNILRKRASDGQVDEAFVCAFYKHAKFEEFTEAQFINCMDHWEAVLEKWSKKDA